MAFHDIFQSMHNKLFENFEFQDIENGYFDVCFKIGEMTLHAHKVILAAVSQPFNVMFADRWTTKDEPIELKEYSYDDYMELMTFIYSGSCKLKASNIFTLVDMAEIYDIPDFKSFCDAFLAKKRFTNMIVFQYVEIARRYSLVQLDEALKNYVAENFRALLEFDDFTKCSKSVIEAFVDYAAEIDEAENEQCFLRVLEWAQKRAETKMNDLNNENFDLKNGIKNELSGILSRFKFSQMSLGFLLDDVAKHSYLFSCEELSKLLMSARKIVVTVTNSHSLTLTGKIPYDREILDLFYPLRKYSSGNYWNSMRVRIPSTPSSLKKNDSIPFYLVIRDFCICLIQFSDLKDTDYLIAEMKSENGFWVCGQCCMNVTTNF